MKKDPTAFRERFKAWKDGKDPYRYLYDNQSGNWNRITDDENADAFANFVTTPNGSRPTFSMYENTPNPTLPVSKNESVVPDNTLWTRQQVKKANDTRTWRSDVADAMHAIGEGAMLASTFAAPEVEPLVNPAYQAIKGIVTNAARSNASKILANPRNFLFAIPEIPPYEILNIPGYLLKTLMRGNQLEKLLSGFGTVNVNNIKAAALKASDVEKEVIDKVLSSEKFAGQKAVDYNDFRKAVHDELITYNVTPDGRYDSYGLGRLGFSPDYYRGMPGRDIAYGLKTRYPERFQEINDPSYGIVDKETGRILRTNGDLEDYIDLLNKEYPILNTYTFSSPRIPNGSGKHYDFNTLGHSRTYTTVDEPETLHVMESQSDWAQENIVKLLLDKGFTSLDLPQAKYLSANYLSRQILENLKHAAERRLTKMRYPTPESAAKIEGYQKGFGSSEEVERLRKELHDTQLEFEEAIRLQDDPFIPSPEKQRVDDLENKLRMLRSEFDEALARAPKDYSPEHKTILKKYADFPKLYKKLYKDADVRTITDPKGNTWYEVDVPKDYLNQEWKYNFGKDLFRRTILRPKLKF